MDETDSRLTGENPRRILQRDPEPNLFKPITFRSVTARNRIMLSSMCQYSAEDGLTNDWHLVHLGARATGGAGFIFTEAVHTEPQGRITPYCLGLWNDQQRDALKRIAGFIGEQGAVAGIQLGHAGRKASVGRPWEGTRPLTVKDGGWSIFGASRKPYADGWCNPEKLKLDGISQQLDLLSAATQRARQAGFQVLELHAAHGYRSQ